MNSLRLALSLLLVCSGTLFAKSPVAVHYLSPRSVRVTSILSGPPKPGSIANQADIQAVLSRQRGRTPTQIARVKSEETLTPAAFSNVLGSWFTPMNLPRTFILLNNAASDAELISASAKRRWNRPRPPLQSAAIHPAIAVPKSPSYPSAHSMRGALWAAILANLAPDLSDSILARGDQIGQDRIIAGVHFPTDVAAGQKLGRYLSQRFMDSPAFRADLRTARAEFSRVRNRFSSITPPHEFTLAASER